MTTPKYIELARKYVNEAKVSGPYNTPCYNRIAEKYGQLAMLIHNEVIKELENRLANWEDYSDDPTFEYIENFRYDLMYAAEVENFGYQLTVLSNDMTNDCEFSETKCGWIGGQLNDDIEKGWKI